MPHDLGIFTDVPAIAARTEIAEALGVAAAVRGRGDVLAVGSGCACFGGATHPISRVYGAGLIEPVSAEQIDAFEAFLRDRGCPVRVEVSPYVDPDFLGALGRRGYRVDGFKHVLVRDLSAPIEPPALPIRFLDPADDAEVGRVGLAIARGFGEPVDNVWQTELLIRQAGARTAFVELDGQVVGGGIVHVQPEQGTAALFAASTLEGYRRRGVQSALIAARLSEARRGGADLAVIQAAPRVATRRNAERAGFQLAYTRVTLRSEQG